MSYRVGQQAVRTRAGRSQHPVGSVRDVMVQKEDGRSAEGFGLGALRFNLLISYSDPLWAGLGITLAAQCS